MPRKLAQFPSDDPEFRRGTSHASGPVNTDAYQAMEGFDEPKELIKITKDNVTTKVVIKALTALAYNAGKFPPTIRTMADQGYEVTRQQIKAWAEGEFAEDYKRIRDNFSKESETETVREIRDIVRQSNEAEAIAIAKALEGFNKPMSAKDAAQAAYYLSKLKQANVDKLQTLLGRPTVITEDRSAEQAIKRLIAQRVLKPMGVEDDND